MKTTVVTVEIGATIGRPVEEVFDRLSDLSGYSEWMPRTGLFSKSKPTGEAKITEGSCYKDSSRIGSWVGEIAKLERPNRLQFCQNLRWLGIRVMEARPGYVLEAVDGATKVSHVAVAEMFGVFRLMKPVTAYLANRERRLMMEALKSSLETRP